MMNTKSNESAVQAYICEYLDLRKHLFWRMNNVPISGIEHGKRVFRAMPKYSMKGVADIIVITDGGFAVFLEVKDKGKQSPEQKEFERLIKEKGGEYHVVRSINDVQEIGL